MIDKSKPYIEIGVNERDGLSVTQSGRYYEILGLLKEGTLFIEHQFLNSIKAEQKEKPNT